MSDKPEQSLSELLHAAQQNAIVLQGPSLNRVLDYLSALHAEQLEHCASATDEVQLRRSQGQVQALKTVVDLFRYTPVEPRRAVSRQLV